ncbi:MULTISPECIES: hypothetical protein [Haloferax]|uniref:Uncharacterized protein n=2 Tax=Haloferax TaxID=2251 RepID=A0A6G1Z2Q3_9EURY|nr:MULTISPECIES: hypothetical protein [Haloferax]KAB1188021.1 hypothetical protein Hfx1149_08230 [Haloferax sp. CBA1149]MRW80691.1 hypothetical protein [Haloferax marinisediminis]
MRRTVLVAASILVLVTAGIGLAFVTGAGPFAGGADTGDQTTEDFPTQTATPTSGDGAGGGSSGGDSSGSDGGSDDSGDTNTADQTQAASGPPFAFTIVSIEECGQTCRDVTSRLTNQQEADATGVTVYSRIFAGNSTASEDEVWRGSEAVGNLDAGESYTTTRRVQLSFSEAFAVQQADGWITVQTTIQTDQRTLTYTERRDVI